MTFSLFLPDKEKFSWPHLYFLVVIRLNVYRLIISHISGCAKSSCKIRCSPWLCHDTSPTRERYLRFKRINDLGTGARFLSNATHKPWAKNYKMYDYITEELSSPLPHKPFKLNWKRSLSQGHSNGRIMVRFGYLGAQILRRFQAIISFLAPICKSQVKFRGAIKRLFEEYLGDDKKELAWNGMRLELMKNYNGKKVPILLIQGLPTILWKTLQPS